MKPSTQQKYYAVLMQVNIGKIVWLVPQKNGKYAWSEEFDQKSFFLSYDEAKQVTEKEYLTDFGFIGSYKIIEFSRQELLNFELIS